MFSPIFQDFQNYKIENQPRFTTCPCEDPECIIDIIIPPGPGDQIKEHGCHCSKITQLSVVKNYLGGVAKIDEIDAVCKQWLDTRKCIQLEGGSCYAFDLTELDYTLVIEGMSHVVSCEAIQNLEDEDEAQCGKTLKNCLNFDKVRFMVTLFFLIFRT